MKIKNIVKLGLISTGLLFFIPLVSATEDSWTPLATNTYEASRMCPHFSEGMLYHHHQGSRMFEEWEPRISNDTEKQRGHHHHRMFRRNHHHQNGANPSLQNHPRLSLKNSFNR